MKASAARMLDLTFSNLLFHYLDFLKLWSSLLVTSCSYICISYNMGKRDLPDIASYIPEPEGCRPEGKGIYIRQIPIAHVISSIYH